ncbi:MAG: hypothetical protein KUG75_04425 [Pseudomonadales bacterium]|nr:hypothetical protein [Pseudomonadales bacterium]
MKNIVIPCLILAVISNIIMLSGCSESSDKVNVNGREHGNVPAVPEDINTGRLTSIADKALAEKSGAPLFSDMGHFSLPITSKNADVQRYFDQGLILAFGFNHAESIRSFKAAQKLDPQCAMCFWGEALATGPNINVTSNGSVIMSDNERVLAYAAIQKAVSLKENTSEKERDYIDALSARYNGDISSDRSILDKSYAKAMQGLSAKYPTDNDAAALYAESLMNTMPWSYWLDDGTPKSETVNVISKLERILSVEIDHPLALHLYIHAVEASDRPERAELAADTLANLVPGSGHLVHMPAHIYWRVGRYHDASEANVRAAAVDEQYIAQCNAQGFYPALYYPHNIHFLWAASSMEGRATVSIAAARKVAANIRLEQIDQYPTVEFFHTIPLLALTQFGRWKDLLAEPQPRADLSYSNAIWHYARGVAYSRTGDIPSAQSELAKLQALQSSVKVVFLDSRDYPASRLLEIAENLLAGEISVARNELGQAIKQFGEAVKVQDELPYTEPPFWYYPTRQSLGVAYLLADKADLAEAVYRKDLEIYPRNGWSMFGLAQSLEAQGKMDEASEIQIKFDTVWANADVQLSSSRF